MTVTHQRLGAATLLLGVVAAACGGTRTLAPATAGPSPNLPAVSAAPSAPYASGGATTTGMFEVDGREMFLECEGTGSPTIIFEAGFNGTSSFAAGAIGELKSTTRACRYDRAGLGSSQPHPGNGSLSVGDRATDLHGLLEAADVKGPYVLLGWSYGGMIVRSFTDRYPNEVAGLVFVDATHEDAWAPNSWFLEQFPLSTDGVHAPDIDRTRAELLAAADLGDRPTIVLTQGRMSGEFERRWTPIQDKLAALSSNALHMVATEASHDILAVRPQLVTESVRAVVDAVRGAALPACGPHFEALGAECLAGTMGDLLAMWDARRAAVAPVAGDLPAGAYGFKEDDVTFTMTVHGGHLDIQMHPASGPVESATGTYAAIGDEVTFVWPFDWRIPRTPGVNTARWTVDPDGTIHFAQLDGDQPESWIAVPWVPISADSPGATSR